MPRQGPLQPPTWEALVKVMPTAAAPKVVQQQQQRLAILQLRSVKGLEEPEGVSTPQQRHSNEALRS